MPRDEKPPQNAVVDAAVTAAMEAVTETAAKRDNNLSTPAVREAKPELIEAMTEAVAATPEVQHVLNTEPFWRKRSFYGAVGGGLSCAVSVALAIINYMMSHTTEEGVLSATALGALLAAWGGYSSWRAGRATIPLGSKPTKLPYPLNK